MTDPVIELDGVSLRYRLAKQRIPSFKEYTIHLLKGTLSYEDFWALRDVEVVVRRGERLGIVGRNGAGKSSLLKVVSRVLRPTRGTATVRGRLAPILELGTGFDFELTGWENVYLNALLLGHSRREVDQAIGGIVAFSELEDFIHAPMRNYSSGMIGRLGFAIATAWVPDVLVLDEVLAVGDAAFQQKCEERMRRFHDAGTTILLVSHSREAILDNCERALWLDHGQVRADGAAAEVLDLYERQAAAEAAAAAQ
ncbi:MAG TPA: ABC transporter ATP-binding protein [Thermoanaerobaculia bacterium]|nr:ABC transporter ATP-binding protein [Thermoanaerobaculia bacterium]